MIIPPDDATRVQRIADVSVPESGGTTRDNSATPPRLRQWSGWSLVSAEPRYADIQPHPWSGISSKTANGMTGARSPGKYHSPGGTSYSASTVPPATIFHGAASSFTTRSRKLYGGAGSRA